MSRPDNVDIAAENPAPSPNESDGSSTTCNELTDAQWVAQRYVNFRLFVRSLTPQEPRLAEWASWLERLPVAVFLAGGDQELQGVRGASDDTKRDREADLVLQRFAVQWDFDLERICEAARKKLCLYIALFSAV